MGMMNMGITSVAVFTSEKEQPAIIPMAFPAKDWAIKNKQKMNSFPALKSFNPMI